MIETKVLLSLHRVNAGIRKRIEAVHAGRAPEKRIGVNGLIMGYLSENADKDVYQRDLEKDLCICRSAVSKMLASLEQGGLVTRERVACDDRLKRIVLTESGRAYTERIRTDNRILETALTSGFSEEECVQLIGFLERMQQNLTAADGKEKE